MRWFCKEVALNMKDTFCGKQNCYMGLSTRCDDFFWRCCKHGSFRLLQFSRDDVPSNGSSNDLMNMEYLYRYNCRKVKWIFTQFARHMIFDICSWHIIGAWICWVTLRRAFEPFSLAAFVWHMYRFSISQCFGLGKSKPDFQLIFHVLPGNGRSGVCPTLRDEVALLNYRSTSWRIWKFLKEIRANYQGQESRTMELHSTLKRSWKSCFYVKNWTGLSKWRYFFNFWLHGLGC